MISLIGMPTLNPKNFFTRPLLSGFHAVQELDISVFMRDNDKIVFKNLYGFQKRENEIFCDVSKNVKKFSLRNIEISEGSVCALTFLLYAELFLNCCGDFKRNPDPENENKNCQSFGEI